jgi:hypothetical protein
VLVLNLLVIVVGQQKQAACAQGLTEQGRRARTDGNSSLTPSPTLGVNSIPGLADPLWPDQRHHLTRTGGWLR